MDMKGVIISSSLSVCLIISIVLVFILTNKGNNSNKKTKTKKSSATSSSAPATSSDTSSSAPATSSSAPATSSSAPATSSSAPATSSSAPAPAPTQNYFLHGPWIDWNKSFRKVEKINKVGSDNVYLAKDGLIKMVSDSGASRYYDGSIEDFDSSKWDTTYNKAPNGSYLLRVCPVNCTEGCDNNKVCSSSPYRPARYVRLQRTDNKDEAINILEIEVYNQLGQKISNGITPSLSPQYGGAEKFGPKFLIDGIFNSDSWKSGLPHTTFSKDAYMELDMGSEVMISKVIVKNRLDCCKERIVGTSLILQDANKNEIYRKTIDETKDEYIFEF
jgi:hypothetical protein